MNINITDEFYDLAISHKMYSTKSKLKYHFSYLFNNVDLEGKKVLDVGGGLGLLTFYAAVKGAKKVICLEPESEGSSNGMINTFNIFKNELQPSLPIEHQPLTLQDFTQQQNDEKFDVIVMHNSINHLNEEACINLRKDKKSYEEYIKIFTDVYNKMNDGGRLIIADCSCENFFNSLGLKNIFAPTIEWHIHQRPKTWISLLEEVGFKNPKVEWRSPNALGNVGKVLLGNSVVSFLTNSRFKFTMTKN